MYSLAHLPADYVQHRESAFHIGRNGHERLRGRNQQSKHSESGGRSCEVRDIVRP